MDHGTDDYAHDDGLYDGLDDLTPAPEDHGDVHAELDPASEPRFGSTISYPNLENPDTGNTVEWNTDGWRDAGTHEPVDYWKTETVTDSDDS